MRGLNATTGKELTGLDHLQQSIRDILTTPIGSRVMRRDYGSRLFELQDSPLNRTTIIEYYAATAEALDKWEPRLTLTSVQAVAAGDGNIELELYGRYRLNGEEIKLEGIIV